MTDYICIKECYCGLPGRRVHYKPGDRLREGAPGKHFIEASKFDMRKLNLWPFSEQFDPRSTVQILSDLRRKHGITLDPEETSRKYAFERWAKAEQKAREEGPEKEKSSQRPSGAAKSGILTRDPDEM